MPDEIIKRQVEIFERKKAEFVRVKKIRVPRGPFAICHLGDPHLDDDGCDWPELLHTIEVIQKTPRMYAGNIGDTTNNWVGKLEKLWGHQTTTIREAWQLVEWFVGSVQWAYIVGGNHDAWNQAWFTHELLQRGHKVAAVGMSDLRLCFSAEGQLPVRFHCRHDFKGSSIWNPAHGPQRAAKLDPWADVYICGHRHEWVAHQEEGLDHVVRWALRVKGFKRFDSYARDLGYSEQQYGSSLTTVHRPFVEVHPAERTRVFADPAEAAEFLGWAVERR